MIESTPFVTVIIPCRNEEKYIGNVLDNIIRQTYSQESMEVYVVDGCSTDKTQLIVKGFIEKHPNIFLLTNPDKIVPHALNMAILKSRGDIIIRMDAHSEYPDNYISVLVESQEIYKSDNTGGSWVTLPGNSSQEAKAIALATSHPFGIGNAQYRLGVTEPTWTDTVPYGCYKKEIFQRIGLFDEQLIRNQDDEFNGRLINNGGRILLLPQLHIRYFARENIRKMSKMFYQYGLFKPLVNIKLRKPATIRQLFPPALLFSMLVLIALSCFSYFAAILFVIEVFLYLSLNIIFSYKLGAREKLFFTLLKIFPSIHFSYGLGYLKGVFYFVFLKRHKKSKGLLLKI